jgi:hypothetical protein
MTINRHANFGRPRNTRTRGLVKKQGFAATSRPPEEPMRLPHDVRQLLTIQRIQGNSQQAQETPMQLTLRDSARLPYATPTPIKA